MKTANQEFTGFNEQSITFYISDTNFFVYMFPVRKVYIYQNNIPSYTPSPQKKYKKYIYIYIYKYIL